MNVRFKVFGNAKTKKKEKREKREKNKKIKVAFKFQDTFPESTHLSLLHLSFVLIMWLKKSQKTGLFLSEQLEKNSNF